MKSTIYVIYLGLSASLLYLQSKGVVRALRCRKTISEISIKVGSLFGFGLFISAFLVSAKTLMNAGFFIMLSFAVWDFIRDMRR